MGKRNPPNDKTGAARFGLVLALSTWACGGDATSKNDVVTMPEVADGVVIDVPDTTATNDTGEDATAETLDEATGTDSSVDTSEPPDMIDATSDPDDGVDADDTTPDVPDVVDVPTCSPPAPTTPCEASNALGTCVGAWVCEGTSWVCNAPAPAAETCDTRDNDCNGFTDEGYRDLVSGLYDRDEACGSCATDCTVGLGPNEHAHGRCDVVGGVPGCGVVCCTAGDPHPNCDGSDWSDLEAGGGCETRVVRTCSGEGDCPTREVCVDGECVPNTSGGSCAIDTDCPVGDQCFGGICGCAGDVYNARVVPPNVLFVLDRSSSMNETIAGTEDSKWTVAKRAVRTLTEAYEEDVRFGLKLFPGIDQAGTVGPDCGPGAVWVDPADENAVEINTFLDAAGTSSGTPIAEAMRSLVDYDGLEDATRNNFIILITDGRANCDDPVPEVEALLAETPPIRTFVIGFGDGVDPDQLSAMADAGGTAIPGDTGYYQADDPLALGDALTEIVGNVLGCSYVLGDIPPDDSGLGVYFDHVAQPRDPSGTEGWSFDPATNQVTFFGTRCDTLRAGTVTDLVFVYGCPSPIIIGGP